MKLSFVIPVYNVEKFVERCLLSCLNQDLQKDEYEIVVINDGSKDNSLQLVNAIAAEQPNVVVYSQINAGLSAARNKGLSLAKGDYVWFIDSDDWIESDCIREVYSLCSSHNLDVLAICASECDDNKSEVLFSLPGFAKHPLCGKEFLKKKKFEQCAPFYIFKRTFLISENLSFYTGIFHEDFEFTPRMLYMAERFMALDKPLYNVYSNQNSITRTVNPQKAFDFLTVARSLDLFEQKMVEEELKPVFHYLIGMAINNSLNNSFAMDRASSIKLSKAFESNNYLFRHLKASSVGKYRLEGFLFSLFPAHTVKIYQLLKTLG